MRGLPDAGQWPTAWRVQARTPPTGPSRVRRGVAGPCALGRSARRQDRCDRGVRGAGGSRPARARGRAQARAHRAAPRCVDRRTAARARRGRHGGRPRGARFGQRLALTLLAARASGLFDGLRLVRLEGAPPVRSRRRPRRHPRPHWSALSTSSCATRASLVRRWREERAESALRFSDLGPDGGLLVSSHGDAGSYRAVGALPSPVHTPSNQLPQALEINGFLENRIRDALEGGTNFGQ